MALEKCRLFDPAYKAVGLPVLEWAMRDNQAQYEDDVATKNQHRDAREARNASSSWHMTLGSMFGALHGR